MLEGAKVVMILILIFFLIGLYYLIRFVFQPTRDLMAQPPLFFILLTAMKLGWVVEGIKHFRFMVRFLVSAFKLCPHTHSLLERLSWYITCFVATWRLHRLMRQHDKEKLLLEEEEERRRENEKEKENNP